MPKRIRSVAAFRAAALLTALVVSGCSLQPDVSTRVQPESRTSQPAPPLIGTSLVGASINLASLRGHPVVIDFWASWCGPCRQGQPELNALAARYRAAGVQFLGVDIRDDDANARAFVREFNVPYPSLFDPSADAAAAFDVAAPPTVLVIDASGNIRLHELGTVTDVGPLLNTLLGTA